MHDRQQVLEVEGLNFGVRIIPSAMSKRGGDSAHATEQELDSTVLRRWTNLGKRQHGKRDPGKPAVRTYFGTEQRCFVEGDVEQGNLIGS